MHDGDSVSMQQNMVAARSDPSAQQHYKGCSVTRACQQACLQGQGLGDKQNPIAFPCPLWPLSGPPVVPGGLEIGLGSRTLERAGR
jgi:hypothetical protein